MRYLFNILSLLLVLLLVACSHTPNIPFKGQDLNSLEQAANYITAKNTCKKFTFLKIHIDEKSFLLGAYDMRDEIVTRAPENNYGILFDYLQKAASPFSNTPQNIDALVHASPSGLNSAEEQFSYLTARAIAKDFRRSGIPVMPTSMALGLADAQTNTPPRLSAAEEKVLVMAIKEKMQSKDNDWAENRKQFFIAEEKTFFANNIVQPNVIALESGVQYKVIEKGIGKLPTIKDTITLHYKGTLLNGIEFDSSYARKKPETFKLKEMVPGFIQAMLQIPEGSKAIIFIPAHLAYAEKGADVIPPYAALIFEVELLAIK